MRPLAFMPCALGICASAVILSGCGGSQSQVEVPSTMPQAASAPAAPGSLLGGRSQPAATSLQDIYNFQGSPDGQQPQAPPIGGCGCYQPAEMIVGTTSRGGDANNDGTVYGVTPGKKDKWTERVLYTFRGYEYADGSEPVGLQGSLGQKQWGNVFVSAVAGGTSNNGAFIGLTPTSSGPWSESFIYSFGGAPDGANPWGAVVTDAAGNIYGTTENGGTNYAGTVYRMQPKGSTLSESVLYSFGSNPYDGAHPLSDLVIDKKGALYGTTEEGGSAGLGTVFKLTPSGSGYTESVLHSFQGYSDGAQPHAGVTDGLEHGRDYIYGTTAYGGANGDGTVYKLTPSGSNYKETVIWSFGSGSGDGQIPTGGVCVTTKGVIVGSTLGGGSGGSSGLGTLYTLTPSGSAYKESVFSFTGANGAYPYAGPSVDKKGNVYVATEAGGKNNQGALAKGTGGVGVKHYICV